MNIVVLTVFVPKMRSPFGHQRGYLIMYLFMIVQLMLYNTHIIENHWEICCQHISSILTRHSYCYSSCNPASAAALSQRRWKNLGLFGCEVTAWGSQIRNTKINISFFTNAFLATPPQTKKQIVDFHLNHSIWRYCSVRGAPCTPMYTHGEGKCKLKA